MGGGWWEEDMEKLEDRIMGEIDVMMYEMLKQ